MVHNHMLKFKWLMKASLREKTFVAGCPMSFGKPAQGKPEAPIVARVYH